MRERRTRPGRGRGGWCRSRDIRRQSVGVSVWISSDTVRRDETHHRLDRVPARPGDFDASATVAGVIPVGVGKRGAEDA